MFTFFISNRLKRGRVQQKERKKLVQSVPRIVELITVFANMGAVRLCQFLHSLSHILIVVP